MKKNKTEFTISNLIKSIIFGPYTNRINSKIPRQFPEIIGDYTYEGKLNIDNKQGRFAFGVYKNSNGEKAVAKMWVGKYKDFGYYGMENEVNIYKFLTETLKKIGRRIPADFKNVTIPEYLGSVETDTMICLLISYIKGKTASNYSPNKQVEFYFKITNFLNFLGGKLSPKKKSQIAKRTRPTILMLYPLFLIKAMLTHPKTLPQLIRSIPIYIASIPFLLKKQKTYFGHRDLHLENIMISSKTINIIDLQFCLYSEPLYDLAITLRLHWDDKLFRNKMLKVVEAKYGQTKNFNKVMSGLMVIAGVHGLTESKFNQKTVNTITKFMNFALQQSI